MRTAKKIISIILAIVMIASCMTVVMADETSTTSTETTSTASFSDVSGDELYYNSVMTLNAMGVIKGYEDGSFKPEQNVTRAEFTAMLMRVLKLGSIGSTTTENLPFSDVDVNNSDISWAIPDINTAYVKGAINGYEDGTFRPSDNVAYEEAIKMIVCTLGYTAEVEGVTPWYANYITLASQNGILRVASSLGQAETPATRACIAQLLYDSLEVELVEDDRLTEKTILSDYLGYTKATGVVYSNGVTSLTSPDVNLRDDEVSIYAQEPGTTSYETHTYKITDKSIKDYLGHQLDFYYKDNGADPRTLVLSVLKNSNTIEINAANVEISNSSATQIRYYENLEDSKDKKVGISSDNVVIYNGKLYGANERASRFSTDMIPEVGTIKLIDSNNDNSYDVVEITSYEVYYVSAKTSTNDITDNILPHTNKTIKLDTSADPNLYLVDKNGNNVTFSAISTGNIICVAKSNVNGGEVVTRAVVINDKVTGTITAVKNGKVTVAGKEYEISNAAPWLNGGSLEAPSNQDSGTYYLDINGDIVAYTKNQTSSNSYYGYIIAYSVDKNSFDGDVTVRVLNTTGSTVYIKNHKNTSVDGVTCSTGDALIDALEESADNGNSGKTAVQQLIKYTTKTYDGATVFDKIYTAEAVSSGKNVESDSLNTLSGVTRNRASSYDTTTKMFTCGSVRISASSAVVISVPDSATEYDDFTKTSVSSVFKNDGDYNIEVFDVSAANVPKVIVLYGGADASTKIDEETPVSVLETITSGTNPDEDDEVMYKISGYQSSNSSAKGSFNYWVSSESRSNVVSNLKKGDIFRVGTDRDGYSLFNNADGEYYQMLYQVGENNSFGLDGTISDTSKYAVLIGSVIARDDDTIAVVPQNVSAGDSYDESKLQIFSTSDFSGAQVLIYDNGDGNVELLINEETDYVSALAGLNAYVDEVEPSKVLIYMSKGNVKLLCILPE